MNDETDDTFGIGDAAADIPVVRQQRAEYRAIEPLYHASDVPMAERQGSTVMPQTLSGIEAAKENEAGRWRLATFVSVGVIAILAVAVVLR